MKNRKLIYSLLMLMTVVMSSCFMEKTDPWAPKLTGAGSIQFVVADGTLTGTSILGVVQPSMDVVLARFSRATAGPNFVAGNIEITTKLTGSLTNLTINMYPSSQANPVRETKATITGISGSNTWTQSIATLQYGGVAVTNQVYILEYVASDASGKATVTRVFQVSIIA